MTAFRLSQPLEVSTAKAKPEALPPSAGQLVLDEFAQALPALGEAAPKSLHARLESLRKETDETLLAQELLDVGVQLKAQHRIEAAHLLLSRLAQSGLPENLRAKARAEADAIEGKGSLGLRTEFLLSRFSKDATDARVIAPMLAATLIGQVAGTATLARLMGRPASWLTRGLGAELSAGTLGYGSEVLAFAGLNRALSPQATGPFSHDLARSALTIGALRFSGAFVNAGLPRLGLGRTALATEARAAALPFAAHQAGAFLGLVASHKLEEHWGLRPRVEGSTFLLDTFASLVSLGVGAHLGRRVLGERFAQFQQELGMAAKLQKFTPLANARPLLTPALASGEGPGLPNIFMMGMAKPPPPPPPPGNRGGGRPSRGTSFQDSQASQPAAPQAAVPQLAAPQPADPQHGHISVTPTDVMPRPPSEIPDPFVGNIVDGRYRINRKIGFGGMGVVYEATHQVIGKRVALKLLRAEHAQTREVAERFLNEARAASMIGNPHIIDINDFGRFPDGSPYFVMEFLEGAPLYSLVEGEKPVPVPRLVHIARQVAEGLGAAHNKDIVHRDLKPDNIFLINKGNDRDFTKILDFGIAKMASTNGEKLTRAGDVFGTPQYMSPEQAAGLPVDRRGDIYSFGIILYELASGKVPFDSANVMSILQAQMYTQPTPLHELVPLPQQVPPGLEAIIMKCLSKKPELRYQTMEELIVDLDKLSLGLVPAALPEMQSRPESADIPVDYFRNGGTPPRILMRARRRWPLYAGIGIGGASILGSVFYAMSKSQAVAPQPVKSQGPDDKSKPDAAPVATTPTSPPKRSVEISVDPVDAHVFRNGEDLGSNLVRIEIDPGKKVEVEVKREGYKSRKITLDGLEESVSIKLDKEKSNGKPRPSGGPAVAPTVKTKPNPTNSGEVISPWK